MDNNTIEETIEDHPVTLIALNRPLAAGLAALTIYGGYAAGRDGYAKVKEIRANRKAKKAAKKVESTDPTPETEK